MEDDLFNFWGTTLIDPVSTGKSSTRGQRPVLVGESDSKEQTLRYNVQSLTGQRYSLVRVVDCGSTANSLAILEATRGDSQACMFAVGSYISGDNGYFNSLSLNSRQLAGHGLVLPQKNIHATPAQTKCHVTLPYFIPSVMDKHEFLKVDQRRVIVEEGVGCLHEYEDRCLSSLHLVLLTRRLQQNPVRVIMFEPILAGCGGILSFRCYKILAQLAKIHKLCFIVDEILSFGRMGYKRGLYCIQHFPPEMHEYITMVTIGKWLGHGVILKRGVTDQLEITGNFARSLSTKINLTNILQTWTSVFDKIEVIPAWRNQVLEHFGVINIKEDDKVVDTGEDDHWGDGLLIFVAGKLRQKKGTTSGFHSRFLPKINPDAKATPKSVFRSLKPLSFERVTDWSRASINVGLVQVISEYCFPGGHQHLSTEDRVSMHICNGYQRLGVHNRDVPDLGITVQKLRAYDVSLEQMKDSVSVLMGESSRSNKGSQGHRHSRHSSYSGCRACFGYYRAQEDWCS
jgi:hypothetical protein